MNSQIIYKSLLLIILTVCTSSFTLRAQPDSELDYSIVTEDASSSIANDGVITINVDVGKGGFIFLLFDKDPKDGPKAIAYTDRLAEKSYSFTALKEGLYYVCVVDKNDSSRCRKAEVNSR